MNEEEYEGLKRYLKLEILNNCKVINEQELEEIDYLTKFDSVKELVDARKKLEEGLITEAEFDKIHDYYRYAVAKPEEEFDEADFDFYFLRFAQVVLSILSRPIRFAHSNSKESLSQKTNLLLPLTIKV